MNRSTVFSILYLIIAALTWLPGCIYEHSMKKQLDDIHAAIQATRADTLPLVWGAKFEVPFDTLVNFDPVHFTADPASLHDGSLCTMDGPDGLRIVGYNDTTRGVLRFTLYREPLYLKGTTSLRTQEFIQRQRITPEVKNLGTSPQPYTTAAGQVPSAPWWQIAGFMALFLGGCWYIDYRFFK